MTRIHRTAVVSEKATIGKDVIIGPYCVIGDDVKIGNSVELISHIFIDGHTDIGSRTKIYPFASIGTPPQDLKYKGEISKLKIGEDNIIREHVTMNPGTEGGGLTTQIGDKCLFMVATHVAHDCIIGNNVVMANNATLAGHVKINDWVILGGLSAVHQFVRIGRHAIIGGVTGVRDDVIPYGSVTGAHGKLAGLNLVGLKRRGFDRETIHDLRRAFRLLFANEGTMTERVTDVTELYSGNEPVMDIVNFIQSDSSRAICQPRGESAE
ncbi:MAG: acyl-[acyl-carrier-protein]--UDP-N-acetylglucosamine O-acyltransferase [Rhodospirillaceae bacterium]|nr:acyl-[acyl-carrier-protein]--UDP-N-acetylglucosamine O-acyltransferase [Rhodospirillaceae bacterium]